MGVAGESTHTFMGAGCCTSIELLSELLLSHVCGRIMRIPSELGAKRGAAPIIYNDRKRRKLTEDRKLLAIRRGGLSSTW